MSISFASGGSDAGSLDDHAMPKSARIAGPSGDERRILVGLISLCKILLPWRHDKALKRSYRIFSGNGEEDCKQSAKVRDTKGKTSRKPLRLASIWLENKGMMFGWEIVERIRASRFAL